MEKVKYQKFQLSSAQFCTFQSLINAFSKNGKLVSSLLLGWFVDFEKTLTNVQGSPTSFL